MVIIALVFVRMVYGKRLLQPSEVPQSGMVVLQTPQAWRLPYDVNLTISQAPIAQQDRATAS